MFTTMARGIVGIELAQQKLHTTGEKNTNAHHILMSVWEHLRLVSHFGFPFAKILPSAMIPPTMPQSGKFSTFSLAVYGRHPDESDGSSLGGTSSSGMESHQ
jgi:hypothetical protein